MKCHNCQAKTQVEETRVIYLRTLDGLSAAESASTADSGYGLSRCQPKMLL
jgi:hypothetical protein